MRKELYKFPPIFFHQVFFFPRVRDRSLFIAESSIPLLGGGDSEYPPAGGSPGVAARGVCGSRAGAAGQDGLGSTTPRGQRPARPGPRPRLYSLCRAGPVHGGSIRSGVQLDRPGLLLRHLRPQTARRGADGAAAAPLRTGLRDFLRRGKLGGGAPLCGGAPVG